ncbi:MAG: hypothetical protein QOD35_1779 [Nocardioidaceae bacterium]|nr:hypothetical protein [Nocardioidaceae bacterium]
MADIRIGLSGWRYAGWRGDFYPKGLVQRKELAYAAERFSTIEVNGSFYSLQRPASYATWRDETPDDFVFALKGGRFITHMKRLRDVDGAMANFFASGPLALGDKLGPVLWQLPARTRFDADVLDAFLERLPRTSGEAADLACHHDAKLPADRALTTALTQVRLRHAIEPRDLSFADPAAIDLLRRHDVGLVVSDAGDKWPRFEEVTSDLVYVRLHGAEELYTSGYGPQALDEWAARISSWAGQGLDVLVYFDNDAKVHAPYDALALMDRLGLRSPLA